MNFYKNPKIAAVSEGCLFWASVSILCLSAIGKAALVWKGHSYLASDNQVFLFLTNGMLFYAVICIELFTIVSMVFLRLLGHREWGMWVLAWLLIAFAMYRGTLGVVGDEQNCRCFGILSDLLNGRSTFVKVLTNSSLAIFLLTIVATYWRRYVTESSEKAPSMQSRLTPVPSRSGAILFLVMLLAGPDAILGNTVVLEGELSFSFFRPNGTLMTNQTATFSVERGSTNWGLNVIVPGGGMWRYYSNGSEVVGGYYGEFDDPSINNPRQPVTAWLGRNPLDNYYVELPWLAYLTDGWLTNDIPAPWLDSQYQSEAHAFKAVARLNGNSPELPEEVVFTTDDGRMQSATMSPMLHRERVTKEERGLIRKEVSLPLGFTSAVYKANSWAQRSGGAFPKEFELVKYQDTADAVNFGKVQLKFTGRLTNLTESTGRLMPPIYRNTLVIDRRFRDDRKVVDFIHYQLDDKPLPQTTDSNLVSLFEAKLAAAPFDVSYRMRRLVAYALFVLLLIVPLGIALWRFSIARKKTSNSS